MQTSDQVIFVDTWEQDEDFPVFPIGSKPKRMLRAPLDAQEHFIIPGHAYLFKTALNWQAHQIWSEIVAFRIGALLGLPVPPCFVAVDRNTGDTGVLVEFFYGYPTDPQPARLVHAVDFMERIIKDVKRGRPHALQTNMVISRTFVDREDAVSWWAHAIAFDAMIGNADRHPENWGFLFRLGEHQKAIWEMAPLFDNGTSLGYEIQEANIPAMLDPVRLSAYVNRGTHHCSWKLTDDRPGPHFELCTQFLAAHQNAGISMENVIRFAWPQIEAIVTDCMSFNVPLPFTKLRGDLVLALLKEREARLRALLGI